MRKAVHAATGEERGGPDGHLASPIDHEPVLWKAARVLAEEFGGVFSISARFGFLRADWANIGTPVHYEADTEEEMRGRLREAVAEAGLEAADEAAVP
jgi:hypothetical protein